MSTTKEASVEVGIANTNKDIEMSKPDTLDANDFDTDSIQTKYSDAYMRRLRWKIDFFLLPLMWLCYGTQQADKTSISVQAVFGIREDTHLKLHTGKFLSVVIVLWGMIVLCVAFAKNWAHLMVLRTLQGALECTISPTFMLLTGSWYMSREHTLRSLIWGTSNAGISFFLGGLTIFCGIMVWFILGTPREVRWLSEEEKNAAIVRVMANQTGSDREKRSEFKWEQVWSAFRDPQTLLGFRLSRRCSRAQLRTTRSALCGSSLLVFMMMGSLVPAFVGMIAHSQLPTDSMQWTRWGMYIMQVFGTLPGLMIWTFLPSNVAGRTKKTVISTVLFIAYCVGNAVGAQMMIPSDAPKYTRGITACGVLYKFKESREIESHTCKRRVTMIRLHSLICLGSHLYNLPAVTIPA
ncbi:hypothetical protein BDW60DRAFT_218992 [Aspergillus nidulans var. acristatus]